jgi:hypothetical protein
MEDIKKNGSQEILLAADPIRSRSMSGCYCVTGALGAVFGALR